MSCCPVALRRIISYREEFYPRDTAVRHVVNLALEPGSSPFMCVVNVGPVQLPINTVSVFYVVKCLLMVLDTEHNSKARTQPSPRDLHQACLL